MSESLTRKALYNIVWEKPISQIAIDYGLSDRGLGKLCIRNNIPVPPRGYWAKIKAGQKLKKEPLKTDKNSNDEKIILSKSVKKPNNDELSDEIKESIANEEAPENKITVPKSLSKHHPIIAEWNTSNKTNSKLEIRSRRILSVLLFALEKRGYTVEQHEKYFDRIIVKLEEDKICISIREKLKMHKREITDKDRKEHFYFSSDKWITSYEGTGNLVLSIYTYGYGIVYREFLETDKHPFESLLNKIIAYIIKKLYLEKVKRLEREERHRQYELERLELQRQQELIEIENQKREQLIKEADNWIKANNIRAYVQDVIAHGAKKSSEEINKWSKWALKYANELDPTK